MATVRESSTAPIETANAQAPLTMELAHRVCAFRPNDLTEEMFIAARTAIIDTIAVTLLGSCEDMVRIMRVTLGDGLAGPASLIGSGESASVLDATMVNGLASHALDFDDFTQEFGGHPSVPIVAGLLALAQAQGASGREFVAAYVAGIETESRIAAAVHFHHYEKGWHPTSTLGVFGAAASAAHLLKLDVEATSISLAIAASFASGMKANFGTYTKPLHVGHCARSGVHAALLAQQGFTANPFALEHKQGFFQLYNGEGNFDAERMLGEWFRPAIVCAPGISLKQFACCGSTHPAVYMALRLRKQTNVDLARVTRIDIATHPRRLPHTNNPDPRTPFEAKFSMQYCVARALQDGELMLKHFEGDALFEPQLRKLMQCTHVSVDPQMAKSDDQSFGARVCVHLDDGTRVEEVVDHMPGRGALHPMSESELRGKFMDCAQQAVPEAQAAELFDTLWQLDGVNDMRAIQALFGRQISFVA
ncbi:MAG: 2-methylcitrate dehydratase PrpD [Gammaproteobacteria bacterium]|jgi:2-methylcitrate dehydratase PrpD